MTPYVAVFLGGGIGAVLRYLACSWIESLAGNRPLATFVVNVSGCLIAGLLIGYFESRPPAHQAILLFLSVGLLGGYTTFSAFGVDSLALFEERLFRNALLYVGGSVVVSLVAALAGQWISRTLFR